MAAYRRGPVAAYRLVKEKQPKVSLNLLWALAAGLLDVDWKELSDESQTTGHPEGQHNYGLINGPKGARVTINHTLFAHHRRRCPAIANGPADVRNNVIYNFRDGFHHDNPPKGGGCNVVGNYYKRGPSDAKIFPFCVQGPGHHRVFPAR